MKMVAHGIVGNTLILWLRWINFVFISKKGKSFQVMLFEGGTYTHRKIRISCWSRRTRDSLWVRKSFLDIWSCKRVRDKLSREIVFLCLHNRLERGNCSRVESLRIQKVVANRSIARECLLRKEKNKKLKRIHWNSTSCNNFIVSNNLRHFCAYFLWFLGCPVRPRSFDCQNFIDWKTQEML